MGDSNENIAAKAHRSAVDALGRCFQILLIGTFIAFSWLAFMAVHEFGHALTAWLTGGSVALMVLHPLQISWTTFARNPHPQLVAWGGAVGGALLPVMVLITACALRSPGLYLFQFFAGFCLLANGLYLIVDSFGRSGDGGTLIHSGAAQWELLVFGLIATPIGFWLWHGLGPHFGLGASHGRVNRTAVVVSVCLLAITVATELLFYPFSLRAGRTSTRESPSHRTSSGQTPVKP